MPFNEAADQPTRPSNELSLACDLESLRKQFVTLKIDCQRLDEKIAELEREKSEKLDFADDLLQQIRQMEEPEEEAGEVVQSVNGVVTVSVEVDDVRPSPNPTSWRDVGIACLNLSSINGLGKGKRERLIEKVGTLGRFEELRVKAVQEHKPLCAVLPKGIGADIADQLEELFLRWRDQYTSEPDKAVEVHQPDIQAAVAQLVETDATFHPEENIRPEAKIPPVVAVPEVAEVPVDFNITLDTPEAATERYNQLRAAYFANGGNFGDMAILSGPRDSGRDAARIGWDHADCPYSPGVEQDSWFAGFIQASLPTSDDSVEHAEIDAVEHATPPDEAKSLFVL